MRVPPAEAVVAAQAAQRATGILASVQLGQFALESAWGTRCTGRFNYFGVKARCGQASTLCWTHEEVDGQLVPVQTPFRDYDTAAQAFFEHAQLLAGPVYAAAGPHKSDVQAFVRAISLPNRPAYASDHAYADKLLELIRVDRLTRFDLAAGA